MWRRVEFSLRSGGDPHRDLQAAWIAHGPAAFAFEELERLEAEELPYVRDALLKDRLAHWRAHARAPAAIYG